MAFWLALLKTLPFQESWLCTSIVFAARAASGSADAVTEPAPAVPFPFPEMSWHCWSLVSQDPVSNSLQYVVSLLIPVLFPPYKQFSDLCGLMEVVFCYLSFPFPSLPCSAQQCLVFWPKAMGLPKQLSSQFPSPSSICSICCVGVGCFPTMPVLTMLLIYLIGHC